MVRNDATRGVYVIECRRTKRVYVGSSTFIERRIEKHFQQLKEGVHSNFRLQRAYNINPSAITWRILAIAPDHYDRLDIYAMERHWFNEFDRKFNILEDPTDHIKYE